MRILLEYLLVFLVIGICYYMFFAKKRKKYSKKDICVELYYLVNVYGINPKKIDFKKFNIACSIINAFIISSVYIVVLYLVNNIVFQIIIGIVLLLLLIIICYGVLARIYIKKGKVLKNV